MELVSYLEYSFLLLEAQLSFCGLSVFQLFHAPFRSVHNPAEHLLISLILSVCMHACMKQPNHHSVKMYMGSRSRTPHILSFVTTYGGEWLVSSKKKYFLVPIEKAVWGSEPVWCNIKETVLFLLGIGVWLLACTQVCLLSELFYLISSSSTPKIPEYLAQIWP
jgi:hypothetical protein